MKRKVLFYAALFAGVSAMAQKFKLPEMPTSVQQNKLALKKPNTLADSSDFYQWSGSWEHKWRRTFSYDNEGRIQELIEIDPQSGEPVNRFTYYYTHDGLDSLVFAEENLSGQWVPHYRYRYGYDANRNYALYLNEDYLNQNWYISQGDSIHYAYDGQNRVTEMTLFQFNGPNAEPTQKLIWSEFGNDNLPTQLTVQGYYIGQFLDNFELRYMTWRSGFDLIDFNPTSYFAYQYNNGWQPSAYDTSWVSNGRQTRNILFNWSGGSAIDTASRNDYIYDSKDYLRDIVRYNYQNGWGIIDGQRDSLEYGSYDETKSQTRSYLSPSEGWKYLDREVFYYNGLSVEDPQSGLLGVYPNPCKSALNVPCVFLSAYWVDSKGQIIPAKSEEQTIFTDGLKPGLYRLILDTPEGKRSAVVQKLP